MLFFFVGLAGACFGGDLCDPPGRAELSAAISGAAF